MVPEPPPDQKKKLQNTDGAFVFCGAVGHDFAHFGVRVGTTAGGLTVRCLSVRDLAAENEPKILKRVAV